MKKCETVREFQERFLAYEFDIEPSEYGYFDKMVEAGWFDWFCDDAELVESLRELGMLVCRVKDGGKIDLDNMGVFFMNCCPAGDYPLYDSVRFKDDDGNVYTISVRDKRDSAEYVVHSREADYAECFSCGTERELLEWLNEEGLGTGLTPDEAASEIGELLRTAKPLLESVSEAYAQADEKAEPERHSRLKKIEIDLGAAVSCLEKAAGR